ncbi:MAG: cobalt ECF transporter T component CbiQ [Cyanobacteria bacterium Co-bin13]|nr:cobalt ECF transporter T component CbiQ [Cyanobacteria bacterium Co-bin13]
MILSHQEAYIQLASPIHHWLPRQKLISLFALMFAFAAVRHLALLLPMLAVTTILYGLSQLPVSFLGQRLRYPGLFILTVVLVLPLASGETVLWQWGWLTVRQEGLQSMGLVLGRFLSILTLGFILLGTTPFLSLIKAMRSLGLPAILTDMTLLAYRYLYEIADTLATMQQAMRLRGFGQTRQRRLRLDGRVQQQLASLIGTLLIRSYERSERVYKAMRLRGYGTPQSPVKPAGTRQQVPDKTGWALTGTTLALAVGFVVAEVVLSGL